MNQITSDDVDLLFQTAEKAFQPAHINSHLKTILFFSGMPLLVPVFAIIVGEYEFYPYYDMYLFVNMMIYIIQIAFTLFYSKKSNAVSYQNSQLLFLTFSMFKMSMDVYVFFYYIALVSSLANWVMYCAVTIQISGIVMFFLFIRRGKLLLYNGAFRFGGKGIFAKEFSWLPKIVVLFIGVLCLLFLYVFFVFSEEIFGADKAVWGIWIVSIIFQYIFLLITPNVTLIYFCKRRFSKFTFRYDL